VRIAILDGYNLMHRARFGMKGESNIIFTFFRSLRPLVEKLSPEKIYLVLEGVPVHRQQLDAEYKANRRIEKGTKQWDEMEEFRRQKRIIIDLLKNLPVTVVKHPELECDDSIASLVAHHAEDDCTIVSTDTDFIQLLVRENVKLCNPVRKEYVQSAQYDYIMWKSLRGDKTDNITPVSGMTDKAAEKLIADSARLQEFLSEGCNRAEFERNVGLVSFKIVSKEELHEVSNFANFNELRQQFYAFKFFSMVNDTAWTNYTKTFESIYG